MSATQQATLTDAFEKAADGDVSEPEAEPDTPDCHHLPEYKTGGDCIRCDLDRYGAEDKSVKRELTADATGGGQ